MKERTKPTADDVMANLDEASAFIARCKQALRPESLASVPDLDALRRDLYEARRHIQFAEAMAKELE